MPFTISHVAAVVPFSRPLARWRLLSATIIGSMVPDFGFLMPWRPARIETHSAIALLTFCLPVGLATFWIFQRMIKTAVMEVLPDHTYSRWQPLAAPADLGSLRQWVLGACGILAGAITHLVWDAFTHEGARGVRMIPSLDEPIVDFAGHRLMGARLLQDGSSLIGLAVVLFVVIYGLRRDSATEEAPARTLRRAERYIWILAYAVTASLLTGLFLVMRRTSHGFGHSLALMVGNFAIAALRGSAAALVVVSLGLVVRLRANPV
ncbi:MAG: hypothetical protein QOI88_55 [Gammaproteobacteria bacterium]|jgi:hypothetical protein|nr:hypothetical protein [Gammaproteobacteria bacterium]